MLTYNEVIESSDYFQESRWQAYAEHFGGVFLKSLDQYLKENKIMQRQVGRHHERKKRVTTCAVLERNACEVARQAINASLPGAAESKLVSGAGGIAAQDLCKW